MIYNQVEVEITQKLSSAQLKTTEYPLEIDAIIKVNKWIVKDVREESKMGMNGNYDKRDRNGQSLEK